jgi:hypothetical protein
MFRLLSVAMVLVAAAFAPAAQARKAPPPPPVVVDPACLASVPWMANPAEANIQLIGCRPVSQVALPDAEGWRRFETPEGATIEVHRDATWNRRSRAIAFRVRYNGGGSLTSIYQISGRTVGNGWLKAGTFTITR